MFFLSHIPLSSFIIDSNAYKKLPPRMGREITHALPPKFPASSQTAGSVGLNDPPLTPDFAPLPSPLAVEKPRQGGSKAVPPGPSSKADSDRFAAPPALCHRIPLRTHPFVGMISCMIKQLMCLPSILGKDHPSVKRSWAADTSNSRRVPLPLARPHDELPSLSLPPCSGTGDFLGGTGSIPPG